MHPRSLIKAERPKCSRKALSSAWYRAGTSKGLFIQRKHLPADISAWSPIILSIMGSIDGDGKQLNGIGGGTSTTSKVAVVKKSSQEGIDVEYTFIQVSPDSAQLDMTGNCGNIASGVGPYALDEGIIKPKPDEDQAIVRILNTNTGQVIEETIQVDSFGHAYELGIFLMPGSRSLGSPIKVSFLDPAGSVTGKMFPSGRTKEWITVRLKGSEGRMVRATLIDVANPFILLDGVTLPEYYYALGPDASESLKLIEAIRRQGAVQMGLADTTAAAALVRGTPKIAVLARSGWPLLPHTNDSEVSDIFVTSFSMGSLHPSLQLTGAVCLSAAIVVPDTTASDIHEKGQSANELIPYSLWAGKNGEGQITRKLLIQHRGGSIETEVTLGRNGTPRDRVLAISIMRTARRLFEGKVFYNA